MTTGIVSGPWHTHGHGMPSTVTSKTYRFPLETDGAVRVGLMSWWDSFKAWWAGPWMLGSLLEWAILAGGLFLQIGLFVTFGLTSMGNELEPAPGIFLFLAWLAMCAVLALLSVPWLFFVEPALVAITGGVNVIEATARKPLLLLLGAMVPAVILFVSTIPALNTNFIARENYFYAVASEGSFLLGWLFGLTYCTILAVTKPEYPLAQFGLTPAVIGVMFLITGIIGAALAKVMMDECYTPEVPDDPWHNCRAVDMNTPMHCPCPGGNGPNTKCNCPFDNDCNPHPQCYNPGGGSIPHGCKMGCMG